ncbi:MAG: hypothetical protein IPM76_07905 [Chloroflexi bacterium]|nr:hypothetical protein [Chloroflexota bacterium]
MEIGNTSLNNYVLEMDVRGEDANYCGFGYWNYLKLNFAPALQYQFGYTDSNGRAKWLINDSGNWTEILRQDDLDCGRFRFVVTGNSYKVYINGQLAGELISDYAEGPLLVQIDDSVFIDNFEIK